MPADVTILMPAYNCGEFIHRAIASILNQTHKEFEFLIIDDGSDDNTEEIVTSFNDPRIRRVKKKNTGLSDTLNYGLKIASFDTIARMDADDIAYPNRIKKQLEAFSKNPEQNIVGSWYGVFSGKKLLYTIKTPLTHKEIVRKLALYSTIPHSGCMYNKRIIMDSGGYSEGIFEDYDLWLRIKGKVVFQNIPEVLTFVRYRKDSLSRKNLASLKSRIYNIQAPYYENIKTEFLFDSAKEAEAVKGWREYFYGNTRLARKYWLNNFSFSLRDLRVVLGFGVSFLPRGLINSFNELRIRFKLDYLLHYFGDKNINLRARFRKILSDEKTNE